MGNIRIGPGTLYRAPLETANPDESTVAVGAAWGGSWVNMGDWPEGSPITLSMPEEIYKLYSEKLATPVLLSRTRREVMIKGALLHMSVANWEVALQSTAEVTAAAGGGQKGYSSIVIGAPSNVTLYKWGIEALRVDDDGNDQPERWFFHKGFFRMTGDVQYAKTKESTIPFEITIIADEDQAAGQEVGEYQLVTAQATAT